MVKSNLSVDVCQQNKIIPYESSFLPGELQAVTALRYTHTQIEFMDLGPAVVTPAILDTVAFERRLAIALKSMPWRHKNILSKLLKYNADSKELFFSQVKLAAKLKVALSTVKRALARFKELGIIQWIFRGVKKTCLYTLSPFFHSKALRDKFVALVSGFKYIPMSFLLSSNAHLYTSGNTRPVESEPQGTNVESLISKSLSLEKVYLKEEGGEGYSESNIACARSEGYCLPPSFFPKNKEVDMSYSQSLAIVAALSVKSIPLTDYGRVVVGSYPAEAIAFADKEMLEKVGRTQKPMALFESLCDQYCERNGVKPSFSRLMKFKDEHPDWKQLPKHEAISLPPSSPSGAKKSGTSGILKQGIVLPGLQETSTRIQARNAAARGYSPECAQATQSEPEDYRDPATFDRLGEWTSFVLEGKKRNASGEKVNPFWQREIDQYDTALETNADMSQLPAQGLMRLTVEPTPMGNRHFADRAYQLQEKGKEIHRPLQLPNISKPTPTPTHPESDHQSHFLTALAPIAQKLKESALNSIKTVSGDVDMYLDRVNTPIDYGLLQMLDDSSEWIEVDAI